MSEALSLAECVRRAGSGNSGILMYRIQFWQPKAHAKFRDRTWTVKTSEEWQADTGLTPKQYKLALASLKARGLVEVQHRPHPFRVGILRATWVRLSAIATAELGPNGPHQSVLVGTNYSGLVGTNYSDPLSTDYSDLQGANPSTGNLQETYQETSSAAVADQKEKNTMKDGSGKGLEKLAGKPKGFDAVKAMMQKKPSVPDTLARVADLEAVWKAAHAEAYPGVFKQGFSTKAQIKFAKELMAKVPGSMLKPSLEAVVRDWEGFRQYMKSATTVKQVPDMPDVLFLLKYCEQMVNFWQNSQTAQNAINCTDEDKPQDKLAALFGDE